MKDIIENMSFDCFSIVMEILARLLFVPPVFGWGMFGIHPENT